MDSKKHLVLVKNENKTESISQIKLEGNKYKIRFKTPNEYSYNKLNVEYFNNPQPIDISGYIISINGKAPTQWDSAIEFGSYVCLYKKSTYEHYEKSSLKFIGNVARSPQVKSIVEYYQFIAQQLTENSGHLDRFFQNNFGVVRADSVLKTFSDRSLPETHKLNTTPIFPFGVNLSQRQAVINAMQSQISLIQGPPGTGKTQTILNIIANLFVQGKTVAVVAGNNSATANVYEKLQENQFAFIAAQLGNRSKQESFFNEQESVPEINNWILSSNEYEYHTAKIECINKNLFCLLETKNTLAKLNELIRQLETEQQNFEKHFGATPINLVDYSFANEWHTPTILMFLAEFEYYSGKRRLKWSTKLKWLYRYRIYRFQYFKRLDDQVLRGVISEYYERKMQELMVSKKEQAEILTSHNFDDLLSQYTKISLKLFQHSVASHYQNQTDTSFEKKSYKTNFNKFKTRYPVILSTTHSIINNKASNELFDYLIVDEASQVDLVTGTLAMSCAKNLIVVGDLKQLPHIPDDLIKTNQEAVMRSESINQGYNYLTTSLLSSLDQLFKGIAPSTLLKEHYRCHPKIIGFCNQKFYNGSLVILTESESNPFQIVKTTEGNHARLDPKTNSLINRREIDVILNEVLEGNSIELPEGTIGLATPYRAQANLAANVLGNTEVQSDTVYKFQGREKDTILFSSVASRPNQFNDNPNLLNVAVSRARKHFCLITSGQNLKRHGSNLVSLQRYMEYQSQSEVIFESKVVSIFDCLYNEYSTVLNGFRKKVIKKSDHLSENLMLTLLDKVLSYELYSFLSYKRDYSLSMLVKDHSKLTNREKKFASNSKSHVDILLFNVMDKSPFLAIEVDGYSFHESKSDQVERDLVKNNILKKAEIPLLRFSTIGSNERNRLEKKIMQLMGNVVESKSEQIRSTF